MTNVVRKVIQTRPSIDVDFYVHTQEVVDLINEYAKKGKTAQYKTYTSSDGLTYTMETNFYDLDYYYELGNEPIILDAMDKRQTHCENNNISYTVEETNGE
jgi:hypothetical protein